ncbi:hypothetical protein C2845_PM10G11010 [Panicum miliaceum]|uniref:Uncharacterized protein n=1 Tax=Panicum miliaceum TaxID=4540 RepID=A0A3L6PC98_PANMI|nr:hypothetical protein C2845_PM10G11010 [Panicum miliaceum]
MTSFSKIALGLVELDDEMEANLTKLNLAIAAKPITATLPPPTTADVEAIFAQNYSKAPQPEEISYFPPDFILQFRRKSDYGTILSYKFLTDNNHTFYLTPWTHDARSFTEQWLIPLTIEIHGIPPHMFNFNSPSTLLDPHCEIESYNMDKKAGICTVEAFSAGVHSIPQTGFISYPRRTGYGTTIHSFPVTLKTKLSTKPRKLPSDWLGPPYVEIHPDYDNPPSLKDHVDEIDPEVVKECNRAI